MTLTHTNYPNIVADQVHFHHSFLMAVVTFSIITHHATLQKWFEEHDKELMFSVDLASKTTLSTILFYIKEKEKETVRNEISREVGFNKKH